MKANKLLAVGIGLIVVCSALFIGGAAVLTQEASANQTPPTSQADPEMDVFLSENELTAGADATLELNVQNAFELNRGQSREILNARNVKVEISDDGPFDVRTQASGLGTIRDGETVPTTQRLRVPADIEPGTYDITVDVEYTYTRFSTSPSNERTQTDSIDLEVVVPDEPQFEFTNISSDIEPGATGDVEVTIENTGTQDAEDVQLVLTGTEGEAVIFSDGEHSLSTVNASDNVTIQAEAAIGESASGDKPIQGTVTYTDEDGIDGTDELSGSLTPGEKLSFDVGETTSSLSAGHTDDITGEVTNEGPRIVDDAVLVIEPGSESLQIENTRYALPELEAGETADFRFPTSVSRDADAGPRQLSFTVEYTGAFDESPLVSDGFSERIEIGEGQQFEIAALQDTLSVGYDGEITGTLVNDGPRTIDSGVLEIIPQSDSLFVEDTRYALPELEPGEEVDFRYPTDVSGQADEGPRQVQFSVEYTDGSRTVTTDPLSERVMIDPRTDEFAIDGIDTEIQAGETKDVVLELTNQREETLSNIDAIAYTESPLSAPADQAFIPELGPGESTEIDFELAADSNARPSTYPIEIDFEYRTERGETVLSDEYQVPIEVLESEDDGDGSLIPGGWLTVGGLLLLLGGSAVTARWYLNR